jgi:proline utilization trans-activator
LNCVFANVERPNLVGPRPSSGVERYQQLNRFSGFTDVPPPENGQYRRSSNYTSKQTTEQLGRAGSSNVSPTSHQSRRMSKDKAAEDGFPPDDPTHSNEDFIRVYAGSEQYLGEDLDGTHALARAMVPETSLSGSDAFGTEVQSILVARAQANRGTGSSCSLALGSPHRVDPRILADLQRWPSEKESQDLFELVIMNFGVSQQLFDIRLVSKNISRLYHNTANNIPLQGLWFVQVLFILAIGRLLQAGAGEGGEVPGSALFNEGKKHLPQMDEIRRERILGIELYGLGATFLQISDRKEEAYLYASTALRLAISYGLHRKDRLKTHSHFDAVHQNRLWWSTYMQERRLAAAGGFPASIADEHITVPLPDDVAGFPSAAPMRVNVQTAQITSLITSTVYSQTHKTESGFSKELQNIFRWLNDVESMITSDSVLTMRSSELFISGRRFDMAPPTYAKTSASLYLVIHQVSRL